MQATILRTATPFLYYPAVHRLGWTCARRQMMSALHPRQLDSTSYDPRKSSSSKPLADSPPVVEIPVDANAPQIVGVKPPPPPAPAKERRRFRSHKAALTITPEAVLRLKALQRGPTPQLIRIGVRNKGCAGLSYHLSYVTEPEKFDEVVEQDGVKVVIDSKALFSIIGSEMDWQEDDLSSKFAFKNPNIKDACGCGESFTV